MTKVKKVTLSPQEKLIKDLQAQVHDLYNFCVEWRKQNDNLKNENANLHMQIVRLSGIVQYLENKVEANTIRS